MPGPWEELGGVDQFRQTRVIPIIGQHNRRLALPQDELEPTVRAVRRERHIGTAGLEHGQHADQHILAAISTRATRVSGATAQVPRSTDASALARSSRRLVRKTNVTAGYRNGVGLLADAPFEKLVHEPAERRTLLRAIRADLSIMDERQHLRVSGEPPHKPIPNATRVSARAAERILIRAFSLLDPATPSA
jgi:hypothetical protein